MSNGTYLDASFFETHRAFLHRVAWRVLRDEHLADDAVQQAYLRALQSPPDSSTAARSWLARVVERLALRARHREAVRIDREQRVARRKATERSDHERTADRLHHLWTALHALPEPYRTTIYLRYCEDLDVRAIARLQGVSYDTAKSRLRRGLAMLRADLRDRSRWAWALLPIGPSLRRAAASCYSPGLSLLLHLVSLLLLLLLASPPERVVEPAVTWLPVGEPPREPPELRHVTPRLVADADLDIALDPVSPIELISEVADLVPEPFFDPQSASASVHDLHLWSTAVGIGGGASSKAQHRGGGSGGSSVRAIVDRGLDWLSRHQDEDGRWDADDFAKHDVEGTPCGGAGRSTYDVGVTALALLAFLADGNGPRTGDYRRVVRKGVAWLHEQQADDGLIGDTAVADYIYGHAIATLALVEAYRDSGFVLVRRAAQRAIERLEDHRVAGAAWRYERGVGSDTSVTAWCLLACRAAHDAGLRVDPAVFVDAGRWLDTVTDPGTGRCGYHLPGERSARHSPAHRARFPDAGGETLTAIGLLSRCLIGECPAQSPIMDRAARTIFASTPTASERDDHYFWFHAGQALQHLAGAEARTWERALHRVIIERQCTVGNAAGSWDPIGPWGEDGGRVYSTAILVKTLLAGG